MAAPGRAISPSSVGLMGQKKGDQPKVGALLTRGEGWPKYEKVRKSRFKWKKLESRNWFRKNGKIFAGIEQMDEMEMEKKVTQEI